MAQASSAQLYVLNRAGRLILIEDEAEKVMPLQRKQCDLAIQASMERAGVSEGSTKY